MVYTSFRSKTTQNDPKRVETTQEETSAYRNVPKMIQNKPNTAKTRQNNALQSKIRLKPFQNKKQSKVNQIDPKQPHISQNKSQTDQRRFKLSSSYINHSLNDLGGDYMIIVGRDKILSCLDTIPVVLKSFHQLYLAIACKMFHP